MHSFHLINIHIFGLIATSKITKYDPLGLLNVSNLYLIIWCMIEKMYVSKIAYLIMIL